MGNCTKVLGVEDCRFKLLENGRVISEQFRKKDSNGVYVYEGDLITFSEGDNIPEEIYIDEHFRKLAVDSYHAFHLLDDLNKFYKVEEK